MKTMNGCALSGTDTMTVTRPSDCSEGLAVGASPGASEDTTGSASPASSFRIRNPQLMQ